MKVEIITHLNDPDQLEKMYRDNKTAFKKTFNSLYPEITNNPAADFWNARLNFESEDINWGTGKDLLFIIIAALVAGFIAKLPAILSIDEEYFYPRNIGFIVFPFLTAYFLWKNKLTASKIGIIGFATLIGWAFINFFPDNKSSDTLILSCIHLLLFLWAILGYTFVGDFRNIEEKRLSFLKYNGDLVVMSALILIAGGIMTGLTIGLFSLIGFHIEEFYSKNIVVFGLAGVPIVATYLTQSNPQLVGKVSPVIAKLFSPLVVVMLLIYLIAIAYSGKNPYNDREFLLLFNALLIGVMAIIFFSVAETSKTKSLAQLWILLLLSVITIIVNVIALSAILYRISEFGITPNRAAVFGSNVLILINLLLVSWQLFKTITKKDEISGVGGAISYYLPIYFVWTIIVTFIFPLIFGFK